MSKGPKPPRAPQHPHTHCAHGRRREDPYHWLRQRDNPAVIAHLEAENDYARAVMDRTRDLRQTLFEEFKTRIRQDDQSVPYRWKDYLYYERYVEGEAYPIHCRKTPHGPEEILLQVNRMAAGHDYFDLEIGDLSEDQNQLAYAVDTVGRGFFTIRILDLDTGKTLPDRIETTTGDHVWANDNRTIYYTRQDPDSLRANQVYRHRIGEAPEQDTLVFEEPDETYSIGLGKTKSDRFIVIHSGQTLSDEVWLLNADQPEEPRLFCPRKRGLEFEIDHLNDRFFIRTNRDQPEFQLMSCRENAESERDWEVAALSIKGRFLISFELFNQHTVLTERVDGLIRFRIIARDGREHDLDFGEPVYAAGIAENYEPDTVKLRYSFASLKTPGRTYDYDMESRTRDLLKEEEVGNYHNRNDYHTERLQVRARDGQRVPVSIILPRHFEKNGKTPLLLYGYGAYGSSSSADFDSTLLSLLDRGFAYAIAHVRGGQECGRAWYDDGRLLKKENTFNDFIDVARHLISEGYTAPDNLYASGASAGGLLIGVVANRAAELFHGMIADVPFVDALTTMLDDTIPLTTSEYDEWGDPNEISYHDYILGYSPYDNVQARDYPHVLVHAGLHDPAVQYWEPAKWVACLREKKTDSRLLLLKTDMQAGHSGATDR
ncbi:MAG: S9 family peptidase, partial [Verrucomicrobiota bacterium]